jgi:hypothetical protein
MAANERLRFLQPKNWRRADLATNQVGGSTIDQ